MQEPAHIQKPRLTSLQANTVWNLVTYVSFIIWITQQNYQLLQVSPRKIENMISGGVGKYFERNKWGGAYSGPKSILEALRPFRGITSAPLLVIGGQI